ncbi:MAG TPA: choice-of-anchor tandem repeat GloVer-containing protein [Terriglobales bacterium]|nr:choice-of-anchor tandem repeat GloVer-containing protein [Terriglobales bacterium]
MIKLGCSKVKLAVFILCTAMSVPAQTFTKMQIFNGADGANPYVGLTQGPDGNLYGTTIDGGDYGSGNVFRIKPGGGLTSIYSFCVQSNCPDGQYPDTVLALGTDGNLYGTTQNGGTNGGYGTVFKITPSGQLTTLHSFDAADGAAPYGSLVLAADGNFYGTANVGGDYGSGNIFKITPGAQLTVLYSFCSQTNCPDGQYPVGPLIQASDGNIYGTTHAGGNPSCTDGCGTIFKITPEGHFTSLHSFDASDGDYPYGGVIETLDGTFYGTTGGGGANDAGTVFGMNASGRLRTLHSFDVTDGATPYALMLGSDGNLYGTTSAGGNNPNGQNHGTIFEMTPTGSFTTLHSFAGGDGALEYSGLAQGTNGLFYGNTYFGGRDNDGVVFSLDNGLSPFVTFVQMAGKVGQTVPILGQGFAGTAGVSFNGVPASFTVVSGTAIKTTVPEGATTGYVRVTTSTGVLTSNVPFHVIP